MSTPPSKYTYPISAIRVIDGDTIEADVDLGFRIRQRQVIRLAGIDAPELRAKDPAERERANRSTEALKHVILEGTIETLMHSIGLDKYGRSLAVLWVRDEGGWVEVNEWMTYRGYATPIK